jgi:hypothetical protein
VVKAAVSVVQRRPSGWWHPQDGHVVVNGSPR